MPQTVHIPDLGGFAELDAASHRLSTAATEINDALIAWGALALGDYLARHPCIEQLVFETLQLGSQRIVPHPRPPLGPDEIFCRWSAGEGRHCFFHGKQEDRDAWWDRQGQARIQAAFDEADSWLEDRRLLPIMELAGNHTMIFELGTAGDRSILGWLHREDLWARIEASRISSAASLGSPSPAPRI